MNVDTVHRTIIGIDGAANIVSLLGNASEAFARASLASVDTGARLSPATQNECDLAARECAIAARKVLASLVKE